MLCSMAAVAPFLSLPPVTTLTLVRDDVADALAQAEALVAANRHPEAVAALEELWLNVRSDQALALRQRLALSWSEMTLGNLEHAAGLLEQANGIVRSPRFDASDRADVLFRRGCVDFQRGNVAEAINELTSAIELNAQSAASRPLVAANAHEWRSRCYQFRRDWDAAGNDAERALEIALQIADEPAQARALFQASLVAERKRDWLVARVNAEQALELFRKQGNTLAVARMLNNLGGIVFLLGDTSAAETHLLAAIESADAAASEPDLAQAVSSLAQVYLRTDRPAEARVRAERAAELLAGRTDFLDELVNAQLVVARALAAEGDTDGAAAWLDRADRAVDSLGSASHRAAALIARGDLVRSLGDPDTAADYFRRAAESLQDLHF
jgi:tetratricopeptide (TPR) repeat protein